VTGGARGIGRATAEALAGAGARVAIGDLDAEAAQAAAAAIGAGVTAHELDVTDRDSFARFLTEVESSLGPLEVLVNNAGIMQLGRLDGESDVVAQRMVDINVHGVLLGMKLALPGMRSRGGGHVVNIASSGGRTGFAGGATYCGTKFFVYGASEAARAELRGTPIDVTCVMPGLVDTELSAGLRRSRLYMQVEPQDVAAAIVAALRRPRFDVYVPRRLGWSLRAAGLLPRRMVDALGTLAGADDFLLEIDEQARRAYDERASHSDPRLDRSPL
jgi:NADP-dependent 3-hydroxy acid dehydrogenase YdfG